MLIVLATMVTVLSPMAGAAYQTGDGATVPLTGGDAARTGQQPGPAPVDEPDELWVTPLGDEGPSGRGGLFSQPLVADGVVYVVGAPVPDEDGPIGDDPNGFIYAVDAGSGDLLWQVPAVGVGSFSPAMVDGVLYLATLTEAGGELVVELVAVPTESEGEDELWRTELETYDPNQAPPALTVEGGVLYAVASSGALHAFDAKSGEKLWDTEGTVRSRAEPAVSDGVVVVANYEGVVIALDGESGDEIWAYDTGASLGAPAVLDGVAYVADTKGNFYAVAEGDLAWQVEETGAAYTAVSIGAGMAYLGNNEGALIAVSLEDEEVAWNAEAPEPGRDAGISDRRLVTIDDVIVAAADGGEVYSLSSADGDELWRIDVGERVSNQPAVIDGVVYIADTDGTLHAYGGSGDADRDRDEEGDDEDEAPADDLSYTATDAGWSLEWDDSWTTYADPAEDGYLGLENGTSFVTFYATAEYDGDSEACIEDQLAWLEDLDGVSRARELEIDGEPVAGGDDEAAFAAYRYRYAGEQDDMNLVNHFDCRTLGDGESVLVVTLTTTLDSYETEVESLADLLDGLSLKE